MNTFEGFSAIGPRQYQQDTFITYTNDIIAVGGLDDGAGGQNGGKQASQIAADIIVKLAAGWANTDSHDELMAMMVQAVINVDQIIHEKSLSDQNLYGMATTVSAACVKDNIAHIIWVGDSRAYLFRNGKLHRLTADHSLVGEMQISGMLDEDQARSHPQKNVITRALGTGSAKPDGRILQLEPGDGLLLSSDGVMDSLSDDEICSHLCDLYEADADSQTVAESIVQAALDAGTNDNTTAVWYRHPGSVGKIASSFHQLQLARTVNDNIAEPLANSSSSISPKPEFHLEILDSLGNSQEGSVFEPVEIGKSPQADISIEGDPYMDFSHLKLEPTGDGIKVSSLSNRNGTYIKLGSESCVYEPPFDLLVGSTLLKVRSNNNPERKV